MRLLLLTSVTNMSHILKRLTVAMPSTFRIAMRHAAAGVPQHSVMHSGVRTKLAKKNKHAGCTVKNSGAAGDRPRGRAERDRSRGLHRKQLVWKKGFERPRRALKKRNETHGEGHDKGNAALLWPVARRIPPGVRACAVLGTAGAGSPLVPYRTPPPHLLPRRVFVRQSTFSALGPVVTRGADRACAPSRLLCSLVRSRLHMWNAEPLLCVCGQLRAPQRTWPSSTNTGKQYSVCETPIASNPWHQVLSSLDC